MELMFRRGEYLSPTQANAHSSESHPPTARQTPTAAQHPALTRQHAPNRTPDGTYNFRPLFWVTLLLLLTTPFAGCIGTDEAEEKKAEEPLPLRMNHLQAKGTHNSYHLRPFGSELISEYNYSHAPLAEQASRLGVRQFELDVWYIPGLGLRVYHNPYDSGTTCAALTDCLNDLLNWSVDNPTHVPLWILIEVKDHELVVDGVDLLTLVEEDINSVWPRERRIQPDDVRGAQENLRDAVVEEGWPLLDVVRGKAAFALLDKTEIRDAYIEQYPGLVNATLFAIVDVDDPAAALISWTQPDSKAEALKSASEAGFIVRTRSDSQTSEAQTNNRTRLQLALESGAQMISTDFPGNDETVEYSVWIPDGPVRCNPLTAPPGCTSALLEDIGLTAT
jgi:hypothetical protein